MPKLTLECECDEVEHEIWVEAEVVGYGIYAKNGIHSPSVGDTLPCGREITKRDMDRLFDLLDEWGEV